jgi:hypothetical protein
MSTWTTKQGRKLRLLTPAEITALPEGTILTCIDDSRKVVDRDTRGGFCAYGFDETDYEAQYLSLQRAVRDLYYAAAWKSDRLAGEREAKLWTNVRDAAGFESSGSPKPLPSGDLETTVVGIGQDNVEGGLQLVLRIASKDKVNFLNQKVNLFDRILVNSKREVVL